MASTKTKANTTARGLGWSHQQDRARLIKHLTDGMLCWWCGLPMFKDPERNWDVRPLAADHTIARVHGGKRANRMLHSRCNSQRQDGQWDDQRPAITGVHPSRWTVRGTAALVVVDLGRRLMPWP